MRVPKFRQLHWVVVLVVVFVTAVVQPSRPVHAEFSYDDSCGKAVPSELIDHYAVQVKQSDALGLVPAPSLATAPLTLTAGGAASTALLYGGTGAATFLMSWETSCYVLDFVGVDDVVQGTVNGFLDFSSNIFGSAYNPGPLVGAADWSVISAPTACANVQVPALNPGEGNTGATACGGTNYRSVGPSILDDNPTANDTNSTMYANSGTARTWGGTTISPLARPSMYPEVGNPDAPPFHTAIVYQEGSCYNYTGNYPRCNTANLTTSSNTNHYNPTVIFNYIHCVQSSFDAGYPTFDVGGVCGVPPGRFYYSVEGSLIESFMHSHASLTAQQWGWQRRHVADVQCWDKVGDNSTHWVRAESAYWWDAAPTERIALPQCDPGDIPLKWRISAVPKSIGLPLGTISIYTVETGDAPNDWTTGAAPDYSVCLGQGVDCGTPTTDTGSNTCIWGSYTASGTTCGTVYDPVTTPTIAPTTSPSLTTTPEPVPAGSTTVVDTRQPETDGDGGTDPPGTGTDIVVPINPGGGSAVQDGDSTCFDINGWGWLNPIEWVEKPVKCALTWAFVPSDTALEEFITDAELLARGNFPFSLMFVLVDFFSDTADAVSTTSGCIDLGMSVAGTAAPCMDVPSGPFAGSRTTVATIVVGLLIASIAASCVSLVTDK